MKNIFINKKNKIYEEKKANDFRELIDISTSNFGEKTAFTVKDKNNKTLKNISFNDFKNNMYLLIFISAVMYQYLKKQSSC